MVCSLAGMASRRDRRNLYLEKRKESYWNSKSAYAPSLPSPYMYLRVKFFFGVLSAIMVKYCKTPQSNCPDSRRLTYSPKERNQNESYAGSIRLLAITNVQQDKPVLIRHELGQKH
jgi:hypothetical protein